MNAAPNFSWQLLADGYRLKQVAGGGSFLSDT
jgi:hypothetical protein